MADFPLTGNRVQVESFGFDLATSSGTILTSAGAGLTAWSELLASSSHDSDLIDIFIMQGANANIGVFRLDIGIGSAGNEFVILDRLLLSGKPSVQRSHYKVSIPICIPKGARISFRFNVGQSARSLTIAGVLYTGQFKTQQQLSDSISYGFNGNDGVDVDPGSTINTKGAWSEIDPSISSSINGFYLCAGDSNNNSHLSANFLLDVGIGGAGNEVIIAENIPTRSETVEVVKAPVFVDALIATGERVVVRAQCTINEATDRIISASITGFR